MICFSYFSSDIRCPIISQMCILDIATILYSCSRKEYPLLVFIFNFWFPELVVTFPSLSTIDGYPFLRALILKETINLDIVRNHPSITPYLSCSIVFRFEDFVCSIIIWLVVFQNGIIIRYFFLLKISVIFGECLLCCDITPGKEIASLFNACCSKVERSKEI